MLPEDLVVLNPLNGGGVSGKKRFPVIVRRDDRSAVGGPDPPTKMGSYNDSHTGAPAQERSAPIIHTLTSDTESEGGVIQPPDTSRTPCNVPDSKGYYPTPSPLHAQPPNNDNWSKAVVTTYSSAESVVTDSEVDDDNYTTSRIQRLKDKIQDLEDKRKQRQLRATQRPQMEPSRYQILYRLDYEIRPNVRGMSSDEYSSDSDSDEPYRQANDRYQVSPDIRVRSLDTFTDPPIVTYDRWGNTSLQCSRRVSRLDHFLRSNPDISFVVFHDYNRYQEARTNKSKSSCEDEEVDQPTCGAKSIYPVSKELKTALEMILEDKEEYSSMLSRYWAKNELPAPYLFIYHSRQEIQKIKKRLSKPAQDQLDLFLGYVMEVFGEEYNAVDTLLQRKEILPQYLQYLVKKDDILIENKNGEYTAYRAESWPVESIRTTPNPSIATKYCMPENAYESPQELGVSSKWTLNGFTWGFDGGFFGRWKQLKLEMSLDVSLPGAIGDSTETRQLQGQPISDLAVFPLCYAPEYIQKMLYHRGEILWKCRVRQLVSYQTNEQDLIGNGMEQHYMIDMKAYQSLHPNSEKTRIDTVYRPYSLPPKKRLSKKKMVRNNLPGDVFTVLMPPRIKGYNFCQNKWCDLNVDQISDVVWRGEAFPAFHTLQIDYEAKDLLHALVSNYLESAHSQGSDAGKGNSLTLLLHGGPGTGKTHTAENIAQIAKKPLYRVTCSDLGTKAEVVEQNLESAFYLAHIWGCVVLLDEADIFLEQASLRDLEHNALTAVFLRMAQSYDGIVILTSSRVSRFNEAARSHINLALHYPALTSHQRYFIWKAICIPAGVLRDGCRYLGSL